MHGPLGMGGGERPFVMNVDEAKGLLGELFHREDVRAAYFTLDVAEVATVGSLIVRCCLRAALEAEGLARIWFGFDDQARPLWEYRCYQTGAGLLVCEDERQELDGIADFDLGAESLTRPNMTIVTGLALSAEQVG